MAVYIQYYGDSDPSVERMTAEDSKMVKLLNDNGIHFERVAMTGRVIQDFEMQPIIDNIEPKVMEKLRKDPNTKWFMKKHHNQLWQVEVDALILNFEKFKRLVLSNARKHFDEKMYKREVRKFKRKYTVHAIHEELKDQVRDFANELGLNCH